MNEHNYIYEDVQPGGEHLEFLLPMDLSLRLQKIITQASRLGIEFIRMRLDDYFSGSEQASVYFSPQSYFYANDAIGYLKAIPFTSKRTLDEELDDFCRAVYDLQMVDGADNANFNSIALDLELSTSQDNPGHWDFVALFSGACDKSTSQSMDLSTEDSEDPTFLFIMKTLQENNVGLLSLSFSGGGDSGTLDELAGDECWEAIKEMMVPNLTSSTSGKYGAVPPDLITLNTLVYDYCDEYSKVLGNWWDADGGSGRIEFSQNGSNIEVDFNEEESEDIATVTIKTPFTLIASELNSKMEKTSLNRTIGNE